MRKPLVAAFFALAIAGAGAAPAVAAPVSAAPAAAEKADAQAVSPKLQAVTLAGTVALSNCSGSVVRFPNSLDTAPALVLTNGHCLETGFPAPGQVIVNRASSRTFGLLNSAGTRVATLRANKIAYSTMTDTDATIYQLTTTYAAIRNSYGINALTV